ncbi:MAG: MotA/TolQ/ExbB proton channel family protein, partial [Treponema sp.]
MLQSLKAGGFFMIPIIVCGIIATFIIIERCIYFFNTKKRDDALMTDLNNSFMAGNYEAVAVACTQADTPLS